MTLGTGIFLSAVFLGLIFLYHSTKDRWNWAKGTKRLGFLAVGLVVLGGGAGLYAEYFYKSDYQIRTEREAREKVEKEKRDGAARFCLSGDVLRMEKIATTIKETIDMDMSLDEATIAIEGIAETGAFTKPSEYNIKELVTIARIKTSCDHDFYFIVNVTAMTGEKIKSLGFWVSNPPKGYTNKHLQGFSVNYVSLRAERALEEKKQASINADTKRQKQNIQTTATKSKEDISDHCAPDLTRKERLRRLALHGKLKQKSTGHYSTPGSSHAIYFSYGNMFTSCW